MKRAEFWNKRAEFSFVWLFAIFVGAAILFFAIYGVINASRTGSEYEASIAASQFSRITDPLQSGFSESSFGEVNFKEEVKIYNDCDSEIKDFGRNEISISKRLLNDEWGRPGVPSYLYNKFIFSKAEQVGEKFYLLTESFEFPYKVSDLIIMTSEEFCFKGAPTEIQEDLEGLNVKNIKFEDCSEKEDFIQVCFEESSGSCEVEVYGECLGITCQSEYDVGTVRKANGVVQYYGSLIYAAIISDLLNYECNIERLFYRTGEVARIYAEKTDYMNARNCGSNLKGTLLAWDNTLKASKASDLFDLLEDRELIKTANNRELCGVW